MMLRGNIPALVTLAAADEHQGGGETRAGDGDGDGGSGAGPEADAAGAGAGGLGGEGGEGGEGREGREGRDDRWLQRFHAGERDTLELVYRRHFQTVHGAVGSVLVGADRETVIHEVFLRVLNEAGFRQSFRGGDLGAWLAVVGRNHAIDYARRRNREAPAGIEVAAWRSTGDDMARSSEARLLIERFQREVLPPQWRAMFEARFLRHLSQNEAAAELGMRRSTLAYQELRIRQLLRTFLLEVP
jgi:RNA polymerase sigma-70 factor, ECF subfamily